MVAEGIIFIIVSLSMVISLVRVYVWSECIEYNIEYLPRQKQFITHNRYQWTIITEHSLIEAIQLTDLQTGRQIFTRIEDKGTLIFNQRTEQLLTSIPKAPLFNSSGLRKLMLEEMSILNQKFEKIVFE